MRTALLSLALTTLLNTQAPLTVRKADPPALKIEGETLVIVTKVPFKVVAPEGFKLYSWSLPSAWKSDVKNSLTIKSTATITEAPEGSSTVSVTAIDKDFGVSEFSLQVNVGKASPPTPPVPPVDDPLVKALQTAYDAVPASEVATKASDLAKLKSLHTAAVNTCQDARLKTFGQLTSTIHDAVQSMIGTRLKGMREVLAAEKRKVLPLQPDAPLDAAGRETAANLHKKFAIALGGVK